jgi:pilus assembly protein CpaC
MKQLAKQTAQLCQACLLSLAIVVLTHCATWAEPIKSDTADLVPISSQNLDGDTLKGNSNSLPKTPDASAVVPVTSQELYPAILTPIAETISIPLNKANLISLSKPIRDVVIANPEIADVIVKTPTDVYIIGKSLGLTNIFLISENGRVSRHILVEVESDIDAARKAIETLLTNGNIDVKAIGDSLVLTGTVPSSKESADAVAIARRFVKEDSNVINTLRILNDLQVVLKVRVAEMSRSTVKNLSSSSTFSRLIKNRAISLGTASIFPADVIPAATGSVSFNKFGLRDTAFVALEQQGLVKTLAEPALTAISGETANFLAGGEIPTPSGVDNSGNLIVEFKEFGVALSFTPVVLDKNHISLRISTEVSRQSDENKLVLPFGTVGQTVDVLGISIRRAESTVNLASGASMMIAGLLERNETNVIDGTPLLKDIPIIGALFRSEAFQRNYTELVIIVTPYIIRPVDPSTKLKLPTDGFATASDIDIYLFGRLYKKYGRSKNAAEEIPILHGPVGYIMK